MICYWCDTELIWGGDIDIDESMPTYPEFSVMTNLSCPKCFSEVEILKKRDNKGIYKNLSPLQIKEMWVKAERPLNPDIILPMQNNLSLDQSVSLITNAFFKK